MRVIGDIPHSQFKITLFNWNGKYLIKVEAGPYEQTYKVKEEDVMEDDLKKIVNEDFLAKVLDIFKLMHANLQASLPV
jgi:hypothetical protein